MFQYIKTYDAEQFSFIKVPKLLVTDKLFEGLSASAKFLYGLMLDRVSLSLQNRWIDENGNVYIYFTLGEVQQSLGCGAGKAVALLAELDSKKGIGLIERVKQGQGKPDIIYVKNFSTAAAIQTSENRKSETAQTCENRNLIRLSISKLILARLIIPSISGRDVMDGAATKTNQLRFHCPILSGSKRKWHSKSIWRASWRNVTGTAGQPTSPGWFAPCSR